MAKLTEAAGIVIYIIINVIIFPLIVLTYGFIGLIIMVRYTSNIRLRLPSFQFRLRERLDHIYLLKGLKAISHSLQDLLVKR